jgi:hypothetical protein
MRMVRSNQIRAFMVSSWNNLNNGLGQMDVCAAALLEDNTGFGKVKMQSNDEGVEAANLSLAYTPDKYETP